METHRKQLGPHDTAFLTGGSSSERPPVVFAHGMTHSAKTWPSFAEKLAGRKWYAVDLPGHGDSGREAGYSFDGDADALVLFLQEITGPAIVVGHSRGGLVACLAGVLRPDLFAGVYLEDVTPLFLQEARLRDLPWLGSMIRSMGLVARMNDEARSVGWLADQLAALPYDANATFGSKLPRQSVDEWAEAASRLDRDFGTKVSFLPPKPTPGEMLSCFTCPVHLAYGEYADGAVVADEVRWFHEVAADPSSTRFPGAGHFLHALQPAEFGADLGAFLRSHDW